MTMEEYEKRFFELLKYVDPNVSSRDAWEIIYIRISLTKEKGWGLSTTLNRLKQWKKW
jgi:hypothetical protein